MSDSLLTDDELMSLKILTYFYLKIHRLDSAMKAVRAILAILPHDAWARTMLVRCYDAKGKFEEVVSLTDSIPNAIKDDKEFYKSLIMLRARALMKTGREEEAKNLLTTLK